MDLRHGNRVGCGVALALALLASMGLQAQEKAKVVTGPTLSKWDIFVGYSYLAPKGTVQVPQQSGTTLPYSYKPVTVGGLFSGTYFLNRYYGVQAEVGEHEYGAQNNALSTFGSHGNNDGFITAQVGLLARWPQEKVMPFGHALVGGAYVDGPAHNATTWGPAFTFGGGLDIETPLFNHHLAVRLFQADYEYMHVNFGQQVNPPGGRANINAARVSTGLVIHAGSIAPPPPVTLACAASPATVFPGEPVSATATAANLDPKLNALYIWSGSGASGAAASTSVATANLAPGAYTVKAEVKEGKPGKEGLKPGQSAECTANFTVKQFEPPTASVTVNPSTIKTGGVSTVNCLGVSPQNRPLTYAYSATAGSVSGNGNTASYSSVGAPSGQVGITCTVTDDKGQSASANTTLTILQPPPPPQPHAESRCGISFTNDKKRPTRVDNEAKACLDQIGVDLKNDPTAKAVVVGQADAKEVATTAKQAKYALKHKKAKVEDFAAQRAINTKDYLVTEQKIDAGRIGVQTGTKDAQAVDNYFVPAGADFAADVKDAKPVDESVAKPEVRKALPPKAHHKKAAAAKPAAGK